MTKFHELLLLAAEETEHEPTGLDLVLPPIEELIWGALAFLTVLIVLTKVAFPRIRKAVEDRERQIQDALEQGERTKAEVANMKSDYERQIQDARGEANRIIEEARQQADQVRRDLTARAEQEAQQIVQRAQEQIEAERSRTVQELRQTVGTLSVQLAERIVERSIDENAHRDLVESYINELASVGGGTGGGQDQAGGGAS